MCGAGGGLAVNGLSVFPEHYFSYVSDSDKHHKAVLCILYHLSMDEKSRAIFVYTDCIQMVRTLCDVTL